jgi:DNA mismatch endonuclease, patch repair protein
MGIKRRKSIKNYLGRNFDRERTVDKQTVEGRSKLMSKIRSKGTNFENQFMNLLRGSLQNDFQTHVRTLRGTPDIVFTSEKVCVFLDSDFWHGWQYPRWKHLLKNEFWRDKIYRNRQRDIKVNRALRKEGWMVVRIWEHQIKSDANKVLDQIRSALKQSGEYL